MLSPKNLDQLRKHIEKLEGNRREAAALPFSVSSIDACLPNYGLPLSALHEIAGKNEGAIDGAAAGFFAATIAARTKGKILWCSTRSDIFVHGLTLAGLDYVRTIFVQAQDETQLLACVEEGLRHGGLGAVVGEVSRFSMIASRRLQLAAEASGTIGLVVRRWASAKAAADFGQPTAATTRWRIAAAPSLPLPVAGIGKARWHVELLRCKGGKTAAFDMEAGDGKNCLALAAPLVYRPAQAPDGRLRAAS